MLLLGFRIRKRKQRKSLNDVLNSWRCSAGNNSDVQLRLEGWAGAVTSV